jgi:hypothetical protein
MHKKQAEKYAQNYGQDARKKIPSDLLFLYKNMRENHNHCTNN